jgi:hypothetical protein
VCVCFCLSVFQYITVKGGVHVQEVENLFRQGLGSVGFPTFSVQLSEPISIQNTFDIDIIGLCLPNDTLLYCSVVLILCNMSICLNHMNNLSGIPTLCSVHSAND